MSTLLTRAVENLKFCVRRELAWFKQVMVVISEAVVAVNIFKQSCCWTESRLCTVAVCESQLLDKCRVNLKNTTTRKLRCVRYARIFSVLNYAHLYRRQLCKSVLLCAVFTWHLPNCRKRKIQEQILELYRLYKWLIFTRDSRNCYSAS